MAEAARVTENSHVDEHRDLAAQRARRWMHSSADLAGLAAAKRLGDGNLVAETDSARERQVVLGEESIVEASLMDGPG